MNLFGGDKCGLLCVDRVFQALPIDQNLIALVGAETAQREFVGIYCLPRAERINEACPFDRFAD